MAVMYQIGTFTPNEILNSLFTVTFATNKIKIKPTIEWQCIKCVDRVFLNS
jgi:hypothetical protein